MGRVLKAPLTIDTDNLTALLNTNATAPESSILKLSSRTVYSPDPGLATTVLGSDPSTIIRMTGLCKLTAAKGHGSSASGWATSATLELSCTTYVYARRQRRMGKRKRGKMQSEAQ